MIYRLRWYIDYFDRPAYFGLWGASHKSRPAWCHCYEGICRALIQGKDMYGNIKTLAECPGSDFQNFQWMAVAYPSSKGIKMGTACRGQLIGLTIQHRNGQIQVFSDGTVKTNEITYPSINFAAYGR